jgi:hypothetical protein
VRFADGRAFAVTAAMPAIYTAALIGFYPREHDAGRSWRWMAAGPSWTIASTCDQPIVATLDLELWAAHRARHMAVLLDGRDVQALVVTPSRGMYQLGPLTVNPGTHTLEFRSADPGPMAHMVNVESPSGDRRPLSFALGTWTWTRTVHGEQP